ncbi:MAG: glycosyltransferase [Ruminococcaceae bacterium]|nr:glycosyltransferase [Oscillospiraceae bacterium]
MSNKPLFSIILPSYKVESYLEDAVSSILSQSFKDFEIIIVDDASPDSAGVIADSLSEKYSFIKVIHHEKNLGLSEARNSGLLLASGDFVFFMDPDDVISPSLLEEVKKALDKQMSQVVVFGLTEDYYNSENQLCNSVEIVHSDSPLFLSTKEEIRKEMLYLEKDTLLGYAWNKVYSREYLVEHSLSFETVEFIEDIVFNINVFKNLSSLVVLNKPLYHYIKRVNAGLTSRYSPNFYSVHKRRVETLYNSYKEWNMLDRNVYNILGSEYSRYIFSSVQRNCDKKSDLSVKEQKAFIRSVYNEDFFNELIPNADSDSKAVRLMLFLLKKRSVFFTRAVCRLLDIIKNSFPVLFSKIKQER